MCLSSWFRLWRCGTAAVLLFLLFIITHTVLRCRSPAVRVTAALLPLTLRKVALVLPSDTSVPQYVYKEDLLKQTLDMPLRLQVWFTSASVFQLSQTQQQLHV